MRYPVGNLARFYDYSLHARFLVHPQLLMAKGFLHVLMIKELNMAKSIFKTKPRIGETCCDLCNLKCNLCYIIWNYITLGILSLSGTFTVLFRLNARVYRGSHFIFYNLYASWIYYISAVYNQNHYFVLGPILKPKPKLADTFGQYRNQYQNHILQGEYSYRYWNKHRPVLRSSALPQEGGELKNLALIPIPIPKSDLGFGSRYRIFVSVVHYIIYICKKIHYW